eukprot:UN25249
MTDADFDAEAELATNAGDDNNEEETTTINLTGDDGLEAEQSETDSLEAMRQRIKEMEEEAKKMEQNDKTQTGSTHVATGPEADARSVYVGNVDYSTKPEDLQALFAACGALERVTIMCDKWTGNPKGFAYIQFASTDGVENAVLLDGTEFKSRPIKVCQKRTNVPGYNRGRGRRRPRRSWRSRRHSRGYGYYRPRYRNRKAVFAPYQ